MQKIKNLNKPILGMRNKNDRNTTVFGIDRSVTLEGIKIKEDYLEKKT